MHPVSVLNELRQGLSYSLKSRTGSDHEPIFTVSVEVDGVTYLGQGRSKKLARTKAAEAALKKKSCPAEPLNDDQNNSVSTNRELGIAPQNAIVELNEMRPGITYKLLNRTGPDHCTMYTIATEVDGKQYVGQGRSKQLARAKAAEAALHIIKNQKQTDDDGIVASSRQTSNEPQNAVTELNECRSGLVYDLLNRTGSDHEPVFTVAVKVDGVKYVGRGKSLKLARIRAADAALNKLIRSVKAPAVAKDFSGPSFSLNPQNALSQLNELHQGLVYNLETRTGPDHEPVFTMSVQVNGEKYVGQGKTKLSARMQAAEAALRKLKKFTNCSIVTDNKATVAEAYEVNTQPLAECIFKSVWQRFVEATAERGVIKYQKYKVLAGVVMTKSLDVKTAKVIAVTTGTKCIEGKYMSRDGTRLNDSHAEILARRCLMDFLYGQLELHKDASTSNHSIFLRASTPGQLYKLKEGIHFHLFIDTKPCGDARVFSPEKTVVRIDKHPNRIARGLLRTKLEAGEGAIPVKDANNVQTWDKVKQGERLLTMSCSDKIARWNVVGVQGALLASLIQPIYFHSIVLGEIFHPDHIHRAVCGRIEPGIQSLPQCYSLNKPKFALVTSSDPRNEMDAPKFGINWTINERVVEVIDSSTGRTVQNGVSRLTKRKFFARYVKLIKQLPNSRIKSVSGDYSETKQNAHEYQNAKQELCEAFRRLRLGTWVKKPAELDKFSLLS